MSTRWYPLYQRGNPQLRVFLPNFWMKLVAPERKVPDNVVQFHCSMEMTRYDVRNYLEKIYNVYPADIRMRIALGKIKKTFPKRKVIKEDDIKIAYITLPKGESFTFPNLFEEHEEDEKNKVIQKMVEETKTNSSVEYTSGMPGWFKV